MKKIFVIAALAAVSVSCTGLIDPKEDAALDGATSLGLQFWCTAPETRATKPGEDAYNENAILTIDYFVFANKTDAAVKHERFTFENTKNEARKKVEMGDYKSKYGVNGFVYALVNMPETTQIGEETLANLTTLPTLAQLQALPIPVTTFDRSSENSGKFKAQDSFVMASEKDGDPLIPFTLVENTTVEVPVPLSRRAAKLTIDINVADYYKEIHYDQDPNGIYKQTWFPELESIQVYMMHYTDEGTMNGAKISAEQTSRFKTYNRRAFIAKSEDKDKTVGGKVDQEGHVVAEPIHAMTVTGTPFYTYPAEWESRSVNAPFIKIILQWSSYDQKQDDGTIDIEDMDTPLVFNKEFYYKITVPEQLEFTSNYWYHLDLDLSVLGSEADDVYVTIPGEYSVVAWSNPDEVMGTDLNAGRYLSVAGNKVAPNEDGYEEGYETFKVYSDFADIPIITSHPVIVVNTNASKPSATYDTFKSPYAGGTLTYTSGNSASATGNNYKITPVDLTYVKLEHTMIKSVTATGFGAKDVAPITYKFEIQHKDDPSYHRFIKVIQYPAIYISQEPGDNVFLDGYFQHQTANPFDRAQTGFGNSGYRSRNQDGSSSSAGSNGNAGNVQTPYGALGYDGGLPTRMTLVTVSAFSSGSLAYDDGHGTSANYLIADPRVLANSNPGRWNPAQLTQYLTNQTGNNYRMSYGQWNAVENIANLKVGTRDNSNFIAPAFLISSRWGRPGNSPFPDDLETAEKRCATYQEAGYPAGRWRLPTEAEVFFVYQLQDKDLVDGLFTGGSGSYGYWVSSGKLFAEDGNLWFKNSADEAHHSGHSVRCVYDYWYWGDEKVNVNKFTPKP